MKKILLVHNYYGSSAPSGENKVFEAERELLRQRNHPVEEFIRHSDSIRRIGIRGKVLGAISTPWNPYAGRAIKKKIQEFSPDVVHVHNTFPLISPSIFHNIGNRAARVLTLHNYRLFCPAAIPMRDGRVCTECLDKRTVMPALHHGCYRDSRLATLPLAINVALNRWLRTWSKEVDAFIALSDFQRQIMAKAGLPSHKIHVKPNFYPGFPAAPPWDKREHYVVFAGRLSEEKGLTSLLKAWRSWGVNTPELRLVGDGHLRSELERLSSNLPIRFLGQLNATEAQRQIAGARLLILPSECFEGFPMVVREAYAFGTPVAVSNIGPLPSIVRVGVSGVVFEPRNPESLLRVVKQAWETPLMLANLSYGARREFEDKYTEDSNYNALMAIYDQAIDASLGKD